MKNCAECGDPFDIKNMYGDTSGKCRSCLLPNPINDSLRKPCPYCRQANNHTGCTDWQRNCGVIQCRSCKKWFFIESSHRYDSYGILDGELQELKERYGFDGLESKADPDREKYP